MQKTDIALHGLARKKILAGVNIIYNAVKLTLGPECGTVLLPRSFNRGSRLTNDGVTIAKVIEPKDNFENLVATTFKEAAAKTGERVGDGTTSTICIGGNLINNAFSRTQGDEKSDIQIRGMESNKTGSVSLRNHIQEQVPIIKKEIEAVTQKIKSIEELTDIAKVSLGGKEEVAKIISKMVMKTGKDGFITLADSFTGKVETIDIEGARFPMKMAAKRFMNKPDRYEMVAEDCDVLVINHTMDSVQDFAMFWNTLKVSKIIIFAPSFSDEVLIEMVKLISPRQLPNGSMVPSGFQIWPVKCPSLGSEDGTPHNFLDLAAFCGAAFINKNNGNKLKDIKEYDLGFLEKLTVKSTEDREDAVLLGGKGAKSDEVTKRIEVLKAQKEKTKMPEHKLFIDKRIASLASAGGIIKVGAATEAEALPLKHKIEDAMFACQAALRFGYVKGGGLCLKEIAEKLYKDDQLMHDALCAPYIQIQENAGSELEIGKNIIDPAKVVELEVEHALGVAANLITCKAIVPEVDEYTPADGQKEIAKAIMIYNKLWGKQQGLLQDGISEGEREQLQKNEHMINSEVSD